MITYKNNIDALQPNIVVPGSTFYVSSSIGNANNGGSRLSPINSITNALAKCTASAGDYIYLLPGHTETVSAAAGIAINVAGVTIKSLGKGSLRATITLDTATTASITVTAANVSIEDVIFIANLDNIATCFTVSAKDVSIKNNEFRDTSDALHFLSHILTNAVANACDGLTIVGNKAFQKAVASTAFFSLLEDNDRVTITDNLVVSASTADVGHFAITSSKNMTNSEIARNKLYVTGAANASVGVFMTGSGTGHTGVMHNNYVYSLDTTGALIVTATITLAQFENYYTGALTGSGVLWPAADNPA